MYQRRIRSLKTELCLVRPNKSPDRAPAEARAEEAARLLKRLDPRGITIALDVKGDLWSSEDVAKRLEGWMNRGVKTVSFLLGGAHGLAPDLLARANARWSLGRITLPHELAMVVLWEQLYRAQTILRGEPYHKG